MVISTASPVRAAIAVATASTPDPEGRPVAVEVFAGNTSDPVSFKTAITRVRGDFGIERLIMVGDRGMITGTRIEDLRKLEGMAWITALKAPAIAALAKDDGPLQMSLFDEYNLAEIAHPDYPGERLVCCHNPVLAADRARTREALLAATETDLAKIAASAGAGRLKDPDKIGIRVGKVIGKHKMAKHFITEITGTSLTYRRDTGQIAAEAALCSPPLRMSMTATFRMRTPGREEPRLAACRAGLWWTRWRRGGQSGAVASSLVAARAEDS